MNNTKPTNQVGQFKHIERLLQDGELELARQEVIKLVPFSSHSLSFRFLNLVEEKFGHHQLIAYELINVYLGLGDFNKFIDLYLKIFDRVVNNLENEPSREFYLQIREKIEKIKKYDYRFSLIAIEIRFQEILTYSLKTNLRIPLNDYSNDLIKLVIANNKLDLQNFKQTIFSFIQQSDQYQLLDAHPIFWVSDKAQKGKTVETTKKLRAFPSDILKHVFYPSRPEGSRSMTEINQFKNTEILNHVIHYALESEFQKSIDIIEENQLESDLSGLYKELRKQC